MNSEHNTASFQYLIGANGSIVCPKCGGELILRTTLKYRYSNGEPRKFYSCTRWPDCNGTIGAHPNGEPLGIPADDATKQKRILAHTKLDEYRKVFGLTRNATYKALCKLMGLSRKEGHIGLFSSYDCDRLIDLLDHGIRGQKNALSEDVRQT